jgi:hypothetical protein
VTNFEHFVVDVEKLLKELPHGLPFPTQAAQYSFVTKLQKLANDYGILAEEEAKLEKIAVFDKEYFEITGGVPFDHWGKGCREECEIPQHITGRKQNART